MLHKKNITPSSSFAKTSLRSVLIAAGLAASMGMGAAYAADEAAPQAHSDGLGAAVSDTAITAKVKTKLLGEDRLKSSNISVTTTNGVVTLKGAVANADAKTLAEAEAKSVDDVKSVDNELRTPNSSTTVSKTKRVVSDSWITTKVKSEIAADSLSKGLDVSVKTVKGVVVLKGSLATQDAVDHVKDIASKVNGVKSVDTSALVVASN